MVLSLKPTDGRMSTRGLAQWAVEDGWWRPWRLPLVGAPHEPGLALSAQMPAGVRIEFDTDTDFLDFDISVTASPDLVRDISAVEVFVDGRLSAREHVHGDGVVAVRDLGHDKKRVEVWLPHFGVTKVGWFRFRDGSEVTPTAALPIRFVAYGSSITLCKTALYPSQTWPALVARASGWDLCCLGFGGECHLDPAAARYIRNSAANLIHLCVGINIYSKASFSERSLVSALQGFILTIRDGHPAVPIAVTTPIVSPEREAQPNAVGWTLGDVRREVARGVMALRDATGDRNLHVIDGLALLGPNDVGYLADGLHPSAEGYRVLAQRLAPRLQDLYPGTGLRP